MKATLELFNALPIVKKTKKNASKELLEATIKRGFLFSPEVISNYSEKELLSMVKSIGLTAEQLNNSFHKSWNKIKNANIEQLVFEQLVHYFTTYGFEEIGIYDKNNVFIPKEKLEIPELEEGFEFLIIKGYTKAELKEKLFVLLSGIALNENTINNVIEILNFAGYTKEDIENINNKEVKCILFDSLNIIPSNSVEFLRYLVFKATKKTLLIKSPEVIKEIKNSNHDEILTLLKKYDIVELAKIFYRFKPIFLSFRSSKELKKYINKVRRLARTYHTPLKEDYLNSVTSKLKKGIKINKEELENELEKVNVFRKIRLAYALKFRKSESDSILYRIRNGKSYATDFSFDNNVDNILNIVLDSIIKNINLKNKKIYIPDYINYTLPATEKQFTGFFPSGTFIEIPSDMVFGIHWFNTKRRIDLDLSLINSEGTKIGWDGLYRSDEEQILFSGDMTDAQTPKGATELFYIKKAENQSALMNVNYFNYDSDDPVKFDILVAKETPIDFHKNYMVNPNNILAITKSEISRQQKILGLLITTAKKIRFYFAETDFGNQNSSSNSKSATQARKYLLSYYKNAITLRDILEKANIEMVDSKEKADIDLSPDKLEKDTIINLFS